jgi:DNA-binding response OmpR family regulator
MKFPQARILYVEDDEDTRELVILVLEIEDCQVIATASHDEALRLAQTELFDLYLIDNWMPGVSGLGLCERFREFDQNTPILFYSGAAYETDIESALSRGAQGYLVKPAGAEELTAEVLRLISASRTERAIRAHTN